MGWIIFRGKDDPPGTRWSMIESQEARLVPQATEEGQEPTIGIFQGHNPGVIALRKDVSYFETFDQAWHGCQDKVVEEATATEPG